MDYQGIAVRKPRVGPFGQQMSIFDFLDGEPLGKNPGDVWDIHTLHFNSPEKWDHPAQYPEELCRRLILLLTNQGDLVLDPFMGVGTTCFVAESLGRKTVGVEIQKKYFDQAVLRLKGDTPTGQTTIFNRLKEDNHNDLTAD